MATIMLKEMFVVTFEHGHKRAPQVFGPFFSRLEAQAWLDIQPFPDICRKQKVRRPYASPNHFMRASIQLVKDWQET